MWKFDLNRERYGEERTERLLRYSEDKTWVSFLDVCFLFVVMMRHKAAATFLLLFVIIITGELMQCM